MSPKTNFWKVHQENKDEKICVIFHMPYTPSVCVCFWPPVTKWGTVMHEIPISSPPLDDIPSIP